MSKTKHLREEIEALEAPKDFEELVARALAHRVQHTAAHDAPKQACAECEWLSLSTRDTGGCVSWRAQVLCTAITGLGVAWFIIALELFRGPPMVVSMLLGAFFAFLGVLGGWTAERFSTSHAEDSFGRWMDYVAHVCANILAPLWLGYRPLRLLCHKLRHGARRVWAWLRGKPVEHAPESDAELASMVQEYLTDDLIATTRERLIGEASAYHDLCAVTQRNIEQANARIERCAGFKDSDDPFLREQSTSLKESIAVFLQDNKDCRRILEDFRAKVVARFEELSARIGGMSERMAFLALARDADALIESGKDHAARVRDAIAQLTMDLYEATAMIRASIDGALHYATGGVEMEVAVASNEALAMAVLRNTAERLNASIPDDVRDAPRPQPQAEHA